MTPRLKVTRLVSGSNGAVASAGTILRQSPTERKWYDGLGGFGGRVVTHIKALDTIYNQMSGYLWKDSDRGDRFETTLHGSQRIALAESELCRFGVPDPRTVLQDHPQLARRFRRLLRGIPVVASFGQGAGQKRPIGMLNYELDIAKIHQDIARTLDVFYPTPMGKQLTIHNILAERQAAAQREQPLLNVKVCSGVGGQGSSTFIHDAYYTRLQLEKRGVNNAAIWGVLVGPRAFQQRGGHITHNYEAAMLELERVYRDGFDHTFINGEHAAFTRPPFDVLFHVDLAEWPEGEDANSKLSDTAMDALTRQVALGIHLLTAPAMRARLQTMMRNREERDDAADGALDFLASFNAALAAVNLNALEDALALGKAAELMQTWSERCSEM